jgi:hypothetical protein
VTRMRIGSQRLGCVLVIGMLGVVAFGSSAGASSAHGAIDASSRKAARQATVVAADLGAGWTQYRKAGGFQKGDAKSCNLEFGSPLRPSDQGYAGPMFQDAAKQSYVYSYAYVFRTKAGAKAYTAARRTPKFLRCKVAEDNAAAKKAHAKSFVRIGRTTDPAIGGAEGLESFYEEQAGGKNAAGVDTVSADYVRYAYRHGRVVSVILVDTGLASDAAASQELSTRLTAALTAGSTAVAARLTALGL